LLISAALVTSAAPTASAKQSSAQPAKRSSKATQRLSQPAKRVAKNYMYTYQQFKALDRKQQYRYIRGLAKVFQTLSKKIKKSKREKKKYAALLEAIQSFLGARAHASAAYKCIGGGVPVPHGEPECGVTEYAGFSCAQVDSRGRPARMEICNPILFGVQSNGDPVCHATASTSWCFANTRIGATTGGGFRTTLDPVFKRNQERPWNKLRWELHVACNNPSSIAERQGLVDHACGLAERQMQHNDDDDRHFLTNAGRSYEAMDPDEYMPSGAIDEASVNDGGPEVVARAGTNPAGFIPPIQLGDDQVAVLGDALAGGDPQGAVAEGDVDDDSFRPESLFLQGAALADDPNLRDGGRELNFDGYVDGEGTDLSDPFQLQGPGELALGQTEEEIAAAEARAEMLRNATPVGELQPLNYSVTAPEVPYEEMDAVERALVPLREVERGEGEELTYGRIEIPTTVDGTSWLSYRNAPGTTGTSVEGSLPEGEQLNLTGETQVVGNTTWYQIEVDGEDEPVWVSGRYVREGRVYEPGEGPDRVALMRPEELQRSASEGAFGGECHNCEREPSLVSANGLVRLYDALTQPIVSEVPVRPNRDGSATCTISSDLGPRNLIFSPNHEGLDIRTGGRRVPVDSPLPGIVIGHGRRGGYGGQIMILHVPEHMRERITEELRVARVLTSNISLATRQTRLRNYLASRTPALEIEINNGSPETVTRQNLFCMYSHLRTADFSHSRGAFVDAGDRIGTVANSGRDMGSTTGAHLDMRCEAPGEDACTYRGDIRGQGPWCDPEDLLPQWIPNNIRNRPGHGYYRC
jgi:hypothetical protein